MQYNHLILFCYDKIFNPLGILTQASKLPELLLYKQYNYIQGILTVEYLPTSIGRRLDIYEEKRFTNLISNINYHFINSLFNDSMRKKIVLNLAKD